MEGVKRSLFKLKMQITFLSMDNLLKKKKKKKKMKNKVLYLKLIAGFIQKIAFKDFTRNGLSQRWYI